MDDLYKQYMNTFTQIGTFLKAKKFNNFKMALRSVKTNTINLMEILVRKSLIKKDLYQYDQNDKESFRLPEQKFFETDDRPRILYERLSAFSDAADYIATNFPDDVEQISAQDLENCRKLLDYFSFHNYNSSSNGINTRSLKELTDRLKSSNDEVYKKMVIDSIKLLSDSLTFIASTVEEITKIKKEIYKAEIRFEVFPKLSDYFTEDKFYNDSENFFNKLKAFIKNEVPGIEYNKLWIREAMNYCYTVDSVKALEEIKKNFLSSAEIQKTEKKVMSPRERLISIIFDLIEAKGYMEKVYYNLSHNISVLRSREKSFMEKIQDFFSVVFNIGTDDDFIEIEYINPKTNKIQKDVIKIEPFMMTLKQKIKVFHEISKPNSETNNKIKRGTKESLLKFLDTTYFELLLLKERIIGMDSEILLNVSKKQKNDLKHILEYTSKLDTVLADIGKKRRQFIMTDESVFKKKD